MSNNRPEKFDISLIHAAVSTLDTSAIGMHLTDDFAVVKGHVTGLFIFFLDRATPLIVNDYRLGMLEQGEVYVRFNLMERHITPGTLIFIGPGTIVEPIRYSSDLHIIGLGLFHDLPFTAGRVPPLFNGSIRDFMLQVSVEQQSVICKK